MPFRCNYTSCCVEYSDDFLMEGVGTDNDLVKILKTGACPACARPDVDLSGLDLTKFEKKPEPVKKETKKPVAKKATDKKKKEK